MNVLMQNNYNFITLYVTDITKFLFNHEEPLKFLFNSFSVLKNNIAKRIMIQTVKMIAIFLSSKSNKSINPPIINKANPNLIISLEL